MKKELQIFVDYVEGRLNILDFKSKVLASAELQSLLIDFERAWKSKYNTYSNYTMSDLMRFIKNLKDNVSDRSSLQGTLISFLEYHNIKPIYFNKYDEDYKLLLSFQPSWLDIYDDQGIFDNLLAEMPKDLSKSKQIAWGKAKLKELFKYDKTFPRWVQSPEWPIIDGKPLVFSHQERVKGTDSLTNYYFYDPETGKQTVIEQFT